MNTLIEQSGRHHPLRQEGERRGERGVRFHANLWPRQGMTTKGWNFRKIQRIEAEASGGPQQSCYRCRPHFFRCPLSNIRDDMPPGGGTGRITSLQSGLLHMSATISPSPYPHHSVLSYARSPAHPKPICIAQQFKEPSCLARCAVNAAEWCNVFSRETALFLKIDCFN